MDEKIEQFKKNLIDLLNNDIEVKDIVFNIVVEHKDFAECIDDINESNELKKRLTEAHAWT